MLRLLWALVTLPIWLPFYIFKGAWGMLCVKNAPTRASQHVLQIESPHMVHTGQAGPSNVKGACPTCLPGLPPGQWNSGYLVDLLRLPAKWAVPRLRGVQRWLEDLRYALSRLTHFHVYPDITTQVLDSKRLTDGIAVALEDAKENGTIVKEADLRERARGYVAGMTASISALVVRLTGYVLLKVLRKFLGGILVAEDQIDMLRQHQKESPMKRRPIIYLPLHRSHLDYILLTYILWHYDIRVPHVASGDNLNFSCFGWLLRGLGGFFIRRRLDKGVADGERDHVYRAVLHAYMETLLQRGEPLEFFMEGTRSRLGKTLMPKSGLMSVVIDTLIEGGIDDALIVPVSYSYERVLDQGFVEELLGRERVKESLIGVWGSMWKALGERYGRVKVDFGQPASLKALVASMEGAMSRDELELIVTPGNGLTSNNSSFGSGKGLSTQMSLRGLDPSSPNRPNLEAVERRRLVHAVAHHILYEATQNAAVTGTQLVACLLAGKYRQGAWLRELVIDFAWISGEVRLRGAELLGGFGEALEEDACVSHGLAGVDERRAIEAVKEAVSLLGPEIVGAECVEQPESHLRESPSSGFLDRLETDSGIASLASEDDDQCRVFVRPVNSPISHCLLNYYKNGAMHVFALDGLIATAFLSFEASQVDYERVLSRAVTLAQLLADQFLFTKPCERLRPVLEQRLAERFTSPRVRILQRCHPSPTPPKDSPDSELPSQSGPWDYGASTTPLRSTPPPLPSLPSIWELGESEEEAEPLTDTLRISEFDEFYSVRVLRFYHSLLEPFVAKLDFSNVPDWEDVRVDKVIR